MKLQLRTQTCSSASSADFVPACTAARCWNKNLFGCWGSFRHLIQEPGKAFEAIRRPRWPAQIRPAGAPNPLGGGTTRGTGHCMGRCLGTLVDHLLGTTRGVAVTAVKLVFFWYIKKIVTRSFLMGIVSAVVTRCLSHIPLVLFSEMRDVKNEGLALARC